MRTRVDYDKHIESAEWSVRREERLRFAGHRCEVCNAEGWLEVHHRTYDRLGAEMMTDLFVLCEDCHGIFHKAGKITGERLGSIERAADFLRGELGSSGSPVKVVQRAARYLGIPREALEAARVRLGIHLMKTDSEDGGEWLWVYGAGDQEDQAEPRSIGEVSDEAIQRMVEKLAQGVPAPAKAGG